MLTPIIKLTVPARYLKILFADFIFCVNTKGNPIKQLTNAIPIIEPIPKIKIKLKTVSIFPSVAAVNTTKPPLY